MSNLLNVAETIAQLPTMHWSVTRYHDMIAAGVFDDHDKVELLFGKITRMSPIGAQHGKVVNRLLRIFSSALPASDYTLGIQNPVTLLDDTEPEPDIYVARGPLENYDQHPGGEDLLLVIEVSDTTLVRDRTAKLLAYALSSVEEYWIVNIYEKQIERFTDPRPTEGAYANREVFRRGETVRSLHVGDFAVDDLLVE